MKFPLSTGEAARLLQSTEPALANAVRCGQVQPAPDVFAGRRQWYPTHLFQVAKALGVLTPELEAELVEGTEARP